MCKVYITADPMLYESRSRTLRLHGVITTIRLENMFWDILSEMASLENRSTNQLVSAFHDEIMTHRGEVSNFASFLRVTCLHYMRRKYELQQPAALKTFPDARPVVVPLKSATPALAAAV